MEVYNDPAETARVIERLLELQNLRSADRANMKTMLKKVRGGNPLDYQQRYNLWAYVSRYTRNVR